MSTKHNKQAISADEQGAVAVEFALLLPVLMLILMGIMVFGLVLNSYLQITHAAREGVRWASLRVPFDDVETRAQAAAPGIDWSRATFDRTGVATPPESWKEEQGKPITVTITYDITEITALYGPFASLLPAEISSSATQRIE